jgi:hypothetical protein
MKFLLGALFCLLPFCANGSPITQVNERAVKIGNIKVGNAQRVFQSSTYSIQCVELLRNDLRIAWIAFPSKTSIGVVSRICERAPNAPLFRDEPNDGLRKG